MLLISGAAAVFPEISICFPTEPNRPEAAPIFACSRSKAKSEISFPPMVRELLPEEACGGSSRVSASPPRSRLA